MGLHIAVSKRPPLCYASKLMAHVHMRGPLKLRFTLFANAVFVNALFAAPVLFALGCGDDSTSLVHAADAATTQVVDAAIASETLPSSDVPNAAAPDADIDGAADASSDAAPSVVVPLDRGERDAGELDGGDFGAGDASVPDATVIGRVCAAPAVAYERGMAAESEHGYVLTLSSSEPEPLQVGYNTWLVTLTDSSLARAQATGLTLQPFMPAHGHGAKNAPTIVELGEGQYEVKVHFSMPGYWRMTFAFDVTQSAVADAGALDASTPEAGPAADASARVAPVETENTLHETIVLHLCI